MMPKAGPTAQHTLGDQHQRGYWNVTQLDVTKGFSLCLVQVIGRKPCIMNVRGKGGYDALVADLRGFHQEATIVDVLVIRDPVEITPKEA